MQVSVESTGSLERKMTVEVPSDRIDQEVEKRLKSLAGRVRLDGFRPGKVPFKVVKQRYEEGMYQEVVGDLMQRTFQEAVVQEKLRPAGSPAIETQVSGPGKGLQYTATFEVYPEIALSPVDGLEIKRPKVEIGEADIDKMIENLRSQRSTWEPVERAAGQGDSITIDFEGSQNGEPFEGGKGEDVPVELGAGRMIPDFERQLDGLKADDEKTIDVTFPDDYQAEQLKGQTVQFAIKVKSVSERRLPEIDEEFVKSFGVEDGKLESLRADVLKNMQRELDERIQQRVKTQVMDALAGANEIEVPNALIKEETDRLRHEAIHSYGLSHDVQLPDELFADQAKRRVTLGLIIGELVRQQDLKVDPQRVEETLARLAASYEDPQQVIQYYRSQPQAMASVEAMVIEDQVVDWVLEQAKTVDEPVAFDEMMNPSQGAESEASE